MMLWRKAVALSLLRLIGQTSEWECYVSITHWLIVLTWPSTPVKTGSAERCTSPRKTAESRATRHNGGEAQLRSRSGPRCPTLVDISPFNCKSERVKNNTPCC
ncbi:hypothetical protein BD779DRAFT_1559653 [Infundibulicybe gibba]|nr:hypothetical protein BD779DRAFT_1559653 [Infundibulicybe gibba]